jgi:lipopolysaccharide/colanic/teichoic acid biosynthesis glycosyltransferase
MRPDRTRAGQQLIKRALDIAVAGLGLLATSPVLALAVVAIRRTMGPGVIFQQGRPGLGGRNFTLYKLRTMTDSVDDERRPVPEFARVTPLGRFLRTTSIDELPQLWNVLKGDMSLVGPRPLLTRYMERYSTFQRRRHEVKPGITGWAQIHRRTAVTWDEKLQLDVWYVDNWTVGLDLKILVRTIQDVISRSGAPAMDSLSRTADNELEFRGDSAGVGPSGGAAMSKPDP